MKTMSFIGDILSRLHRNGFPEAIVAGGALRDYTHGLDSQIKDIDVFVQFQVDYRSLVAIAFPEFLIRDYVTAGSCEYCDFDGVYCVLELTNPAYETPIQIVVMDRNITPMSVLDRIDFGICQIGYDLKSWHTTEAFNKDAANKTFTLIRCRDNKDRARSLDRFQRLSTKYPGWRLIS